MSRRMRLFLVATLLAGLAVPLGPATAHAEVLDMTCVGTQSVTYSPGVTLFPTVQTITFNTIYSPCVSLTEPDIVSAQRSHSVTRSLSCLDLFESNGAAFTIPWNTGQFSTFSFNQTVTIVGGQLIVTQTGTITDGVFEGDFAEEVFVGPAITFVDCLLHGVTSRESVLLLEITSI